MKEKKTSTATASPPPPPPKPIKEARLPWFTFAAIATIAALTLLCLAEAGPKWLRAWVDNEDADYPQALSVGLYSGRATFLDKTDQPFDPAWCGGTSGNQAPKTEWCSRINAIKGLTLSAILLHGLAAPAFLFFLGKAPKSILALYVLTALFGALAAALSLWLWMEMKGGFCQSLVDGFRIFGGPFRCDLGVDADYLLCAGVLFLAAAVAGAFSTHYKNIEAAPTDNGEQKQQTPVAPAMTLPKLEQAEAAGATAGAGNGYGVEEDEAGEEEPPV